MGGFLRPPYTSATVLYELFTFTLVKLPHLFDVGYAQSITLANNSPRFLWYDGSVAVLAEGVWTVMHDGGIIVRGSKRVNEVSSVLSEVAFRTCFNVAFLDCYILIAVRA